MKSDKEVEVLILGAGMAGLGAGIESKRRNLQSLILESADAPGGLCRNTTVAGFDFDYGPKVLILDDSPISKDLLGFLGDNYEKYDLIENTYISKFGLIGFPVQRNLVDLPSEERKKVIESILHKPSKQPTNYKEWLVGSYGEYLAKTILIPYEEKKWQRGLDKLDFHWALSRPVKVDMEEVARGSKVKLPPNKVYYYPKKGNISTLTSAMAKEAGEIELNSTVTVLSLKNKFVEVSGKRYFFKKLISTIPLDRLISISTDIDSVIKEEASSKLQNLSIKVFNLVFKTEKVPSGTAIYFPEKEYIFRRVSVLNNLCPALAKAGFVSISIEISVGKNEDRNDQKLYENALRDLLAIPQFRHLGKPFAYGVLAIPFAYPIQSDGLRDFVNEVHDMYQKYEVYNCGRGGSFDYCNSDKAYEQGVMTIRSLVSKRKLPVVANDLADFADK